MTTDLRYTIATRTRTARKMRRMLQGDITRATGLPSTTVSQIERKQRVPSAETIVKLCAALHVSSDYLLGIEVVQRRLVRRLERRDRRIAGLERKIRRLEEALSWRTIDLESLSRNVRREVQDALCNVRMIPVFGGKRDQVITEVRNSPANR